MSEDETTDHAYFGYSDRMFRGEAMLVDTGARNNLVGSKWVTCMDKFNCDAGKPKSVRTTLKRPVKLGGAGKKTQQSTESVTVPTTVSGDHSVYQAAVIKGSILPALLGLNTLKSITQS